MDDQGIETGAPFHLKNASDGVGIERIGPQSVHRFGRERATSPARARSGRRRGSGRRYRSGNSWDVGPSHCEMGNDLRVIRRIRFAQ